MKNSRKHILYLLDFFHPHVGGVENLFADIIKHVHHSYDVSVLTCKHNRTISEYEKKGNIEIYRRGLGRYLFMFSCLKKGMQLARKSQLIHATTYSAAIPAWFIGKLTRTPVILTVHEIFGKQWFRFRPITGGAYFLFERLIFLFSFDQYVCISHATSDVIQKSFRIPKKKIRTIHNGINLGFWDRQKYQSETRVLRDQYELQDAFVGLFFGRPGISKGLESYVRAISGIREKIPNFHAFLIVSHADKKRIGEMKKLLRSVDSDFYTLIPSVNYEDLPKYILDADCVVVPSLAEGFGLVAAEVSALKVPLVCSKAGSLPEVASGKVLFFEPGNVQDLISQMAHMKSGKYEEIPYKKFGIDTTVQKYLDMYKTYA